jgi:glutathione S-transferase
MMQSLVLISHVLCPYVQRAAIVLTEKKVPYERRNVDLTDKPQWFLNVSPLAKTPVLLVDDEPIFESAVICEYLDETIEPRLHPVDPLQRARHRSWMEFGSNVLNLIAGFYNAPDERTLTQKRDELKLRFEQIEYVLGDGPFFGGDSLSIVDAVFGPIFRYFDVFDQIGGFNVFETTPKVSAWRAQLASRQSIIAAVDSDYPELLARFLREKNSALGKRILIAR